MNLQPISLGPTLVYESEYKFDKKSVLARAESLAANTKGFGTIINPLEIGDAGSTAMGQYDGSTFSPIHQENQPHTWPELQGFVEWLGPIAERIFKIWEFDFDKIAITNSWVNRHRQGGWTNFHVHHNSHLSLAAYIQADELSGHLLIEDPLEPYWTGYPCNKRTRRLGGYRLPALDNKVYLFSSFLRHGTEASKSNQDRWVLSINLECFKSGRIPQQKP
jgi:uncharacterized protein (TIGR02466 family)